MRTFRNTLLAISKFKLIDPNSKSSFYVLLVAFIILLLATENIIKQTLLPL